MQDQDAPTPASRGILAPRRRHAGMLALYAEPGDALPPSAAWSMRDEAERACGPHPATAGTLATAAAVAATSLGGARAGTGDAQAAGRLAEIGRAVFGSAQEAASASGSAAAMDPDAGGVFPREQALRLLLLGAEHGLRDGVSAAEARALEPCPTLGAHSRRRLAIALRQLGHRAPDGEPGAAARGGAADSLTDDWIGFSSFDTQPPPVRRHDAGLRARGAGLLREVPLSIED